MPMNTNPTMSSRIPFKRVSDAFDELARARLCESSGSEHSAYNSAGLSDLVNSFIEDVEQSQDDKLRDKEPDDDDDSSDDHGSSRRTTRYYASDSNELLSLRSLLGLGASDDVKSRIRSQVELAYKNIKLGGNSLQESKRAVMDQLRESGIDAGVCKSRWKKTGHFPTGDYEYLDVVTSGTRYIVQVNLGGEFSIARPSSHYQSLLQAFPPIFVGEPDELKQVVKLMCTAVKKSMKLSGMHLPAWRKNDYMLAKWFGTYRRTTNVVKRMDGLESEVGSANKRLVVGFETSVQVAFDYKRVELGKKMNFRVGNLAQVLN